jgi:hypothetical protein
LQEDPAAASTAVGLHPAQGSLHHPCQGNSEVVPLQIAELHKKMINPFPLEENHTGFKQNKYSEILKKPINIYIKISLKIINGHPFLIKS